MAFTIRHILNCLQECKKEVIICVILIGLTIVTLFWPGDSPSVILSPAKMSESKHITKNDFYLCSIDFSNSEWAGKYKKFACYFEIDGKEYHVLDEKVTIQEKNVAFGLPDYVFNSVKPGKHKCRMIIRPAYQYGDDFDLELIETTSNPIILSF